MVQMRTQLEQLQDKKNKLKNNLTKIKNNYIKTIYVSLCEGKNYNDIHKELYEMTINNKVYSERLYKSAVITLKKANKKMPKTDKAIVFATKGIDTREISTIAGFKSLVAYSILHKMGTSKQLEQEIYKDVNDIEAKEKEDILHGMYELNRSKKHPTIFYLASGHSDAALDHKDRQLKIYVDEKWETLVNDKQERDRIRNYIKQKNIKTIQWVTHKPVWFVTRPNCRHYFKAIATEEVIGHSIKKLIAKNDMHRQVGRRLYIQTLNHPITKKWYEDVNNAKSVLNKYKERLTLHRILYMAVPNDLLKNAITKDKMLINKWQRYLQTRK